MLHFKNTIVEFKTNETLFILYTVCVSGIVRTTLGVELLPSRSFTYMQEEQPKLCGFHNRVRIAATNTNTPLMKQLWSALHKDIKDCSRFSSRNNKTQTHVQNID